MDNLELVERVVGLARRAGAEQCDVYLRAYEESEITVRLGQTDRLVEAGTRGLGLRVINGGRTAVCSTSDFHADSLERLARDTVELATISAPDPCAGLPDAADLGRATADGLQLYDERVHAMAPEEKIAMALACESAARGFDSRITNSDGATVSTRVGEVALANSLGFAAAYPVTAISLAVEVMADDAEGKKRNAYWFSSERSLHRLLPAGEVGRVAARRAVDQIGARKVATCEVPIVFEPLMAVQLLGNIAQCVTGSALYRGATFLAGCVGERIGSPLVRITDDPLDPGRGGSRPFDGEGVAARRTEIVEDGVLRSFLFDSYTARRTGNRTTGSAGRSVEGSPTPGPSNLTWHPGPSAPGEIVAAVDRGLYLTALMGHGFNPATGDFSQGAAGFWIEGGQLAFPVTEVNVSGRLDAMLAAVDAAGTDLTWFGAMAAPTLRVATMTVSGL